MRPEGFDVGFAGIFYIMKTVFDNEAIYHFQMSAYACVQAISECL